MAKNNTQAPKGVFEYKNTDPEQGRKVVNFTITGRKVVDAGEILSELAEEMVDDVVNDSESSDHILLGCRAEVTPFIKPEE